MSEYKHNELIAERIQELATAKNLTINRIATIAGITTSTVNSVFTGKSKNPTIGTIKNISEALDISIKDFFDFYPYNVKTSETKQSKEELKKRVQFLSKELDLIMGELQDND